MLKTQTKTTIWSVKIIHSLKTLSIVFSFISYFQIWLLIELSAINLNLIAHNLKYPKRFKQYSPESNRTWLKAMNSAYSAIHLFQWTSHHSPGYVAKSAAKGIQDPTYGFTKLMSRMRFLWMRKDELLGVRKREDGERKGKKGNEYFVYSVSTQTEAVINFEIRARIKTRRKILTGNRVYLKKEYDLWMLPWSFSKSKLIRNISGLSLPLDMWNM